MERICQVCNHHCRLQEGQIGRCGARKNEGEEIQCDNYGRITSAALDPIEKKPLRRFYPQSKILSVGSYGCNMSCAFCQNHEISMKRKKEVFTISLTPEELCQRAKDYKPYGNIGVAFTYNEPLIGYEYVRDCARLLRKEGMKTVIVTNGCFTLDTAKQILPYTDAMNIDLKGFTEAYYKELGGDLQTVKDFIREAQKHCHVELTTLVVPGKNDGEEEIEEISRWISEMSREIPLHISRYFPNWKMQDVPATDPDQIYRLAEKAGHYLKYVYTGNC